jgi:hypothetical protein
MNYQNIEIEIKKYSEYFKSSQNKISKLTNYYKEVGKRGIKFVNKINKPLDELYSEILKENRNTSYNKFLLNIYNTKKIFLEKIKLFFINIEKNLRDKFSEYEKDYKAKNKDLISKLNSINTSISDGKLQMDKSKNQYFEYCKSSKNIENKMKPLENNSEKKDVVDKLKTKLKINEDIKELRKNNYKTKQINLNKLLDISENSYLKLINEIEIKDIENMKNINSILINDSSQILSLFIKDLNEYLKKIDSMKKILNAKIDWKNLKVEFNFNAEKNIIKEKRFLLEDFLDYDSINNEDNLNYINDENNNNIIIPNGNYEKFNRIKKILKI